MTLDGIGSSDRDDDPLRYRRSQYSGESVVLSSRDVVNPTFTAPEGLTADAVLSFGLLATDPSGRFDQDTVTVTVEQGTSPPVTEDQIYYFPHLAVGAGWQTTITYINYSPQEVTCQTDFLSDQGNPLMVSFAGLGAVPSRTDVLLPGGSVHQETNVELSAPPGRGWARATCSGPVKASLLYRLHNREGVPIAEAGVNATTVPATRFVTFAEQAEGQFGTGVAYANPSPTEALVTFTARDAYGQMLASVDQNLSAGGHGAQNMAPLFGLSSFTGSLEVTSTEPIVSLSLNVEAAPVFSSLPPGELDAAAQGSTTYYFPHLAVAEGWQTTITYINYSPQDVSCQTEFLSDHGSPLMVSFAGRGTLVSRPDVLLPGGSVHEETNVELSAPPERGWARATCSGPVKASLLYRLHNSEGVPTGEAAANATTVPATRFVTFAEQGEGQSGTGVAYANPSDTAALVTFTARDADGRILASIDKTLLPNGHDAQNMALLFGLSSFTGSLEITSTEPIVSLSLNFEAAPVFSSLPPGELDAADIPGEMLAPANEAAFNDLVVGKRAATGNPTVYVDFVSPGRFRETEGADTFTGSYTYQNTGSNTGTLTFSYDDGERCTSSLTFISTTAATETYTCNDGSSGKYTWQLVEIPASDAPDFVVQTPSVSDSSPNAGESFTLSATVRNQGRGRSDSTTLRFYRSTDTTISASDTEVATDAVGALAASGSSAQSVELTAPSTAGTYYYGACVDAVAGESDTTDNCSGSVRVDVSEPRPQTSPDLVVGSPSVNDNSQETEGSFTLSATVQNSGDGTSPATTLRYYRSTDATITRSDMQVGTDAVGELSASGTSAESIDLTAPSTADTYYYGACVDAVTGESSATNNCSSSAQVDVTEPPPSNRSPEPVGQIASRTLEAGGSETLDVSSYFNDADSDELAYAAASSDRSVATARASGSAVTVTAVASGEAVVTVTASDPGGLTAEQGIAVTVAADNRPPIATKTIPDQTIHVWGELQTLPSSKNRFVVRGIHNYFSDPDGDPLQYGASSSDERYATVRTSIIPALDHYQMIVDPVAVGQATITLTATDPEGLNANYVFGVNVSPPLPNRRPVVQWPIGVRQVYVGVPDVLRLRDHFRDEDVYGSYFQLNYAVSSADNGIALVRVWDKRDHETGHGYARLVIEGVSAGETTATVVATDRAGLSVGHTFNIIAETRPPRVTRRIGNRSVSAGTERYVWHLNNHFADPDGHELVYDASSANAAVLLARVSASHPDGPYVVLSARTVGTADVTVTATDVTGLTASQTFTVTVVAPRPPTITRRLSDRSMSVGSETLVGALQYYFSDPEGGELAYDASSANAAVVLARVGEDAPLFVVLSARTVGTADITVTATDVTGLSTSQTFTVTVTR